MSFITCSKCPQSFFVEGSSIDKLYITCKKHTSYCTVCKRYKMSYCHCYNIIDVLPTEILHIICTYLWPKKYLNTGLNRYKFINWIHLTQTCKIFREICVSVIKPPTFETYLPIIEKGKIYSRIDVITNFKKDSTFKRRKLSNINKWTLKCILDNVDNMDSTDVLYGATL